MPDFLNLPSAEQFQELINVQRLIAGKGVQDVSNTPGPKTLLKGDANAGFYGFVTPNEMGLITSNPTNSQAFSGANLALASGISAGTAMNSDVPLMKFAYKGKTLFVPLKGYRHSIPWDTIYNAGAVFGASDEGFLPPAGRSGVLINIDSTDNSINTTTQHFLGDKSAGMDYADTVGAVGDTLVLKGWANPANNVSVVISSITNTKIIVTGATLVTETGGKLSRFYNNAKKVTQNKQVTIGGKVYKVRLMKGAGANPTDAFADADRGAAGTGNEWNSLILPLHEHAKLGNWAYAAYAVNAEGAVITSDWNIGLTDENLLTHYNFGSGSYTWCQEVIDNSTYRRVLRGYDGASNLTYHYSWFTYYHYCWRPVLESL